MRGRSIRCESASPGCNRSAFAFYAQTFLSTPGLSSLYGREDALNLESMNKLFCAVLALVMLSACLLAADAEVGGDWEMTMDSPHGKLTGPLTIQQEGAKFTGTYETEHTGKLTVNGKVDGDQIVFTMVTPGGEMTITFEGAKDGDKLSGTTKPLNGEWSAVRKKG